MSSARPSAGRVVLATTNAGKQRELASLLAPSGIELVALSDFPAEPVCETGETFVENALLKARSACLASGLPTIADDSGLVVDALDGRPGVRSARYAGPGASDQQNVGKLLACMQEVPDALRGARFVCVVVHLRHAHDPYPVICQGVWAGQIARLPRGAHGFGYDPVFLPDNSHRSAAELSAAEKNRLSHRGTALRALVQSLAS